MKNKFFHKEERTFFFTDYAVPILFLIIVAAGIPLSGYSASYLIQEMVLRLSRDSFLVLSLLVPIMAGMGLNFGIVLGSMAGQIGLIFITDWGIAGIPGLFIAGVLGTPVAVLLGYLCGKVLNKARGKEMVSSYILGFFINGLYQFVGLYMMGKIIPIIKPEILISRGYGIRNAVSLVGIRGALDKFLDLKIMGVAIPVTTYLVIVLFCFFIVWIKNTKIGQDMRAVGQNISVAELSGINVNRTRTISIIISTVLASYGQIIFLQNLGTMNTYTSHEMAGVFSIAALLVGGATVAKASLVNVFLGVVLFHMLFIISPMAGKRLIGSAQLGEYFRVFVSYGVISMALVLHAVKARAQNARQRIQMRTEINAEVGEAE
jgi:simple sugar transport system permease protein